MSSSTSDSSLGSRIINSVTGYISYIQQKQVFTRERCQSIRVQCFRIIGFTLILYTLIRVLISVILSIKTIARLLSQMLLIICLLPFKFITLFLPETTSYKILFPLFCFGFILSSIISKLSYKKIEIQLDKRFKLIKRHSFILTFIILLLLQSLLIILPVALSIRTQKKLSLVNKKTNFNLI